MTHLRAMQGSYFIDKAAEAHSEQVKRLFLPEPAAKHNCLPEFSRTVLLLLGRVLGELHSMRPTAGLPSGWHLHSEGARQENMRHGLVSHFVS